MSAAHKHSPLRSPWTWLPVAGVVVLLATWSAKSLPVWAVALVALVLAGCVISAVVHAESLAHRVGEPFGALLLALAVTVIEVSLIVTLMVSESTDASTIARDTVFAAIMIACTGVVGLAILIGTWRAGVANFNAAGTAGSLAAVGTLATLSLVLPTFTTSTPGPTYSTTQLVYAAVSALVVYLLYVFVQTIRNREDFVQVQVGGQPTESAPKHPSGRLITTIALLLISLVGVVGLAKVESKPLEKAVVSAGLPTAVVGVLIALVVLGPETVAAARSARRGDLQTSLNLAYGSAMASIGLTIPVVAVVSYIIDRSMILGLNGTQIALLVLAMFVGALTVVKGRATLLEGGLLTAIFAGFVTLTFVP
jgi:Ca2+:H+ antiporter